MRSILNRFATPFTVGLFLVSAISGVALFLHLGSAVFHGMHEWLSLILLLPFALHFWRNWGSMLGNLRRGWLVVPLGLSLIAALAFAVPALTGKAGNGSPPMQAVSLLTGAQLGDLGPILHESPEALAERLRAHGLPVPSTSASLQEIAAAAGRDARQLLFGLMARR